MFVVRCVNLYYYPIIVYVVCVLRTVRVRCAVRGGARGEAGYLHELLLGALGADDVLSVGNEALADERGTALRADEAVVVPVSVFERDEASAADTWKYHDMILVKKI